MWTRPLQKLFLGLALKSDGEGVLLELLQSGSTCRVVEQQNRFPGGGLQKEGLNG